MPGYTIPAPPELLTLAATGAALLALGVSAPKLHSLPAARATTWLAAIASVAVTHFACTDAPAGNRMLALVAVFMLAMKAVVHTEHTLARHRPALTPLAYLRFALFSLGMRPAPEHRRPRPLLPPLLCLVAGALFLVAARQTRYDLLLLAGLTLTVHFGLANLTAALAGQPPLFKNPTTAKSPADFWAHRWNLGYVEMMATAVRRPAGPTLGLPAVFLASGLFHELAITLPVRTAFGLPTLYFVLQAILAHASRHHTWPRPLTLVAITAPLPLVFPPAFIDRVLWPLLNIYP